VVPLAQQGAGGTRDGVGHWVRHCPTRISFAMSLTRRTLTRGRLGSNCAPPMALVADIALPTPAAERPNDAPAVERLILAAFRPGRFAKAAERLREGRRPDPSLSLVAWDGDCAVGCVRLWPIRIGETPALLLGPFAVDAAWRSQGLGAALIEQA